MTAVAVSRLLRSTVAVTLYQLYSRIHCRVPYCAARYVRPLTGCMFVFPYTCVYLSV